MKKTFVCMLVFAVLISCCACGSSNSNSSSNATTAATTAVQTEAAVRLSLGDTASTDIWDFTLRDAKMSYYASTVSSSFGEPSDSSGGYAINKGSVLIIPTFTVKNKDRTDQFFINGVGSDKIWKLSIEIKYNGALYSVFGTENDFGTKINLWWGGVSHDNGITWDKYDINGASLSAGESVTFRPICKADFEPSALDAPFELILKIPSSSGEETEFVYSIK